MILVMILWGFNVSAIKIIVGYFPPVSISALRIFTAGLAVFVILGFLKKIRKPSISEWKFIVAGGLLNISGHHYFLSLGLTNTSATNGGLILGSGPLLTALLAAILLRRIPSFTQVLGFLIGGLGLIFIVLSGGNGLSELSFGDLFIFLAIFVQALSFILISKATRTLDPLLLTGYMLIIGSIFLFVISLLKEPVGLKGIFHAPLYFWVVFLSSALLATAFGNIIYNSSISKIGAAETSIFLNLSTFFSLVGAFVLLGEQITLYQTLGCILIIIGILFGSGAIEEIMQKRRKKFIRQGKSQSKSI
ncbi:DMT family transporter [Cytobacillus depressus]|uniref:DMT family transporter n=2 Tax=Cytobacillus depressus TaxID=1602942 RepID=A0A6L3V5E5_9BACI|nr:DMT family transporter [Cytobacillus depressus]